MTNMQAHPPDAMPNDDKRSRFPVPFTLAEFRQDIVHLCLSHVQTGMAIANTSAGMRFVHPDSEPQAASPRLVETAADVGLTYAVVADWDIVRSLESMYRFGFLGQRDASVEELGPGGYHIAVAAIVRDLSRSGYLRFLQHIEVPSSAASIARCMYVIELANARLTLEGLPRFFNFDGRDDDIELEALINGGDADMPQGGYGAALTIRQMALLSGLEEQSIRAFANPKRPDALQTEQRKGRVVVRIDHAKEWLRRRQRYLRIQDGADTAVDDLAARPYASLDALESSVLRRLALRHGRDPAAQLADVVERHLGTRPMDQLGLRAWMLVPACFPELADMLGYPSALFQLRVSEAVFADHLRRVRHDIAALSPAPR